MTGRKGHVGGELMPPQRDKKAAVDVVEIDSSDDESGGATAQNKTISIKNSSPRSHSQPQFKGSRVVNASEIASSDSTYRPLESRSFWKAGAYEVAPSRNTFEQGEVEHARVHPKFLHSNATSHKWAFGAIAELLDNAVDEIYNGATYVKVDRIYNNRDHSPALVFQDDGGGMDPERIRKCMSLGYSSKTSNKTIGQCNYRELCAASYGNGFKTSTMRLGADAIVFSRASRSSRATQSVGLLSYTFLRRTGQDDVIVPMIDFDISDHWAEPIIYTSQNDWSTNLKTILEWSPFASKDDLLLQFEDIGPHGTKIIVYNLWMNDEGIYELNFDDDDEDIRLRDEGSCAGVGKTFKRALELQSHVSYRLRYSLRAYASILYLRKLTNFKIILRGKPVEQFDIADDLKHTEVVTYRPQLAAASKEICVEAKIGFIKEAPALGICGFNVYHKNRLIRPFWKVTADGSSKGNGVVGVLEANFIEPAHDKQDFERSILFFRLEMKLKQMVSEYWKFHCHLIGHQPERGSPFYVPKIATVVAQVGVSKTQKQQQTGGHVNLNVSVIGLAANARQCLDGAQIGNQHRTSSNNELSTGQPIIGSATESVQEGTDMDSSESLSIDRIREENIQLFMRCEEYNQKENELKRTIEELAKELEETKRKCVQISSHLETQKSQKLSAQQMQNA